MSTPPHERARGSEREPHRARELAESFGADAARYDRARPRYPAAMVERVVAAMPGRQVVDVGCGTGIAARQFQAAGCSVVGVEVDARMAEWARHTGLEVEVAAFESWDPVGRVFDAIVSGQTWHWIEPVTGTAKAAEVLRSSGVLAVFWNVFRPSPEVAGAFSRVYRRVMPDLALDPWAIPPLDAYAGVLARAGDGMRAAGAFSAPQHWQFDWQRTYTRDEWLDQVPTFGDVGQFSPDELAELLAGVGETIDVMGGSFTMPYATVVIAATRLGVATETSG